MKKLLYFLFFSSVLVMSACSGDDGAIGPQGDPGENGAPGEKGDQGDQGAPGEQGIPGDYSSKMGYFEGTVTGHRQDGTAFSEPFKFEFAYGVDKYNGVDLHLNRFETLTGAVAYGLSGYSANVERGFAMLSTFVDGDAWEPYGFDFGFMKELNSTTLFELRARPYVEDVNYDRVIELSPEMNGIYKFPINQPGNIIYFEADTDADAVTDAWTFQINSSDNIAYYSMATGELLYVQTPEGNLTTGELFEKYNDIKFVEDATLRQHVFVKTADESPAWEFVESVPADEIAITNFVNQDGVVSFDFNITISKYRGYLMSRGFMGGWVANGNNTTRHDLTITGKFSSGGKVYESTVGRKGVN